MRQLCLMAESRSRQLWDHTASVIAMLVNVNLARGERVRQPVEFHPHHQYSEPTIRLTPKQSVEYLARMYGQGN